MTTAGKRWQRGTVRRRGDRWTLRARFDNPDGTRRERVHTIGSRADLRTEAQARAAADAILQKATGRAIAAGSTIRVGEYFARYLVERVPLMRPTTQRLVRARIRHHLAPLSGSRLDEITRGEVQRRIAAMSAAGAAPSTIRGVVALLATIIRAAIDDGFAATAIEVKRLKFPSERTAAPRRQTFTAAELRALLAVMRPPWRELAALSAALGLRSGEALGLAWSDIDLQRRVVRLRQAAVDGRIGALKTSGSGATLPLSPALVQLLAAYRARRADPAGGLVFTTRTGRPIHSSAWRRAFRQSVERAGLLHRSPHTLRHTAASLVLEAGLSAAAARDLLRHGDVRVTNRYSHAIGADVERGASILSEILEASP